MSVIRVTPSCDDGRMLTDTRSFDEVVSGLADAQLGELLQSLDVQRRRLEARLCAVIGEADRREAYVHDGHSTIAGWCRALTRWSSAEVAHRQRAANLLRGAPEVGDALLDGTLGVPQLHELARAYSNPRCGKQLVDVLPILLQHAQSLSFHEFRIVVRRWEALADTDGAFHDDERIHAQRNASVTEHDGVVTVAAKGGGLQAAEMLEVFRRYCDAEFRTDWDATRRQWGDEACPARMPRTDAQRRFDALHHIFADAASAPADARPSEPLVNVVVDLATFEKGFGGETSPPPTDPRWQRCETSRGMRLAIDDVVAAALLGQVRRVVFDSAGVVLDMGRKRRLFTGAVRDAVLLGSTSCAWAGCAVSSASCQADHLVEWQHQGGTSSDNGAPLCKRHNLRKSRGYRVVRDVDGYWHTYRPDGTELGSTDPPVP